MGAHQKDLDKSISATVVDRPLLRRIGEATFWAETVQDRAPEIMRPPTNVASVDGVPLAEGLWQLPPACALGNLAEHGLDERASFRSHWLTEAALAFCFCEHLHPIR
jgi:hypothetical protein